MKRKARFAVALILILGAGCVGKRILMNVNSYSQPDYDLRTVRTFKMVILGLSTNELMEQTLLAMVRDSLESMGMQYNADSPDVVIGIVGKLESHHENIPGYTAHTSQPPSGTSPPKGFWEGFAQGLSSTQTTTVHDRAIDTYYRAITIGMAESDTSSQLLWLGSAESWGSTGDLMIVAPHLINGILSEFPVRSGKGPKRSAKM
ncbi:MAG TPA: DUF4136 domain-containing protein [candidate division Zixibacteria bacterium]|jgi:hypothetical protein